MNQTHRQRRQLHKGPGDPWEENRPLLRRLYLDEGKRAREVKEIMEGKYGFPQVPYGA